MIRFHCYRAGVFHTYEAEKRKAHALLVALVAEGWIITKREEIALAA